MQDRNVQWPNRYQLTKVPGTDDIYDLTPAPGTITAEGTMINKASLLTDETAQAYGFTEEELADVVPDDVLAAIKPLIDAAQSTANAAAAVEYGSYVGTGTYQGLILQFSIQPYFVILIAREYYYAMFVRGGKRSVNNSAQSAGYYSVRIDYVLSGNTLTRTSVSQFNAMNDSGETYYYLAIGPVV